jgi:hypothetical protein
VKTTKLSREDSNGGSRSSSNVVGADARQLVPADMEQGRLAARPAGALRRKPLLECAWSPAAE